MNKTAFTIALLTTTAGASAAAASEPTCFVETSSGQRIDLTSLCGAAPAFSASSRNVSAPEVMPHRKNMAPPAPTGYQTLSYLRTPPGNRRDLWQQAAQSVIAMRPYGSGNCRIGNRPCHWRSRSVSPRYAGETQPLILIIEAESRDSVLILEKK